jgi:uncharacterized protein (TIGR02246 family)
MIGAARGPRARLMAGLALTMLAASWLTHAPPLAADTPAAAAETLPPEALAAIRQANEDWLPAMQRADAAAIAAPYASEGLFISAKGDVIRGREAIEQFYAKRLALMGRITAGELHSDATVLISPTRIYEWGHASLTLAGPDGQARSSGGNYLTVWEKDAAGRWQITRNIAL